MELVERRCIQWLIASSQVGPYFGSEKVMDQVKWQLSLGPHPSTHFLTIVFEEVIIDLLFSLKTWHWHALQQGNLDKGVR